MHFVHDIEVVYGDEPSQAPANRILEINNQSDDINYQYCGKYVWLVPRVSPHRTDAATAFEVAIQKHPDDSLSDLAKGAGGDYRYLLVAKSETQAEKVTEVALLRLDHAMGDSGRPAGWDGNTIDINKGRGKTYLYLLWKTASSGGPSKPGAPNSCCNLLLVESSCVTSL